jgi:hypothetical protein
MSFKPHQVVLPPAAGAATGMAASLQKAGSTRHARLVITLQVKTCATLAWRDGDRVEIQLGEAEHHGLIRLRKSDAGSAVLKHRVSGDGTKRGGPYFQLPLGHIEQFVNRSEARRWVQFETLEDGWIELVLPRWADETGPNKPKALTGPASLPLPPPRTGRSVTAAAMGDPDPSRSALGQRGGK